MLASHAKQMELSLRLLFFIYFFMRMNAKKKAVLIKKVTKLALQDLHLACFNQENNLLSYPDDGPASYRLVDAHSDDDNCVKS